MTKEFLLNQMINEFKKQKTTREVDRLLDDVTKAIENGKFSDAENLYSEITSLYKTLTDDLKKKVFDKCVQVHKRIEARDTSIKDDKIEPQLEMPADQIYQIMEKGEFIKTSVPGFDDLIEEGIPVGSNVLVSGGPGSGKTTFCTQALMNNASKGTKCLYMSFEESEDRLKRHLRSYGFNPDQLEKHGHLLIKRYDPFLISRSVEALLAEARGELVIQIDKTKGLIPDDFKPEIIVVDSLSAIAAAFAEKEEAYRIYIEQLFRSFERLGVTSFLIAECEEGTGKWSKTGVEEFLADGVIAFYNMKKGNTRINAVEVVKVRGTSHKKKIVPFNFIKGKGIEVYPLQEIFMGN